MNKQFTLTDVQVRANYTLHLRYADDQTFCVHVLPIIQRVPVLAPLGDIHLFRQARVGESGACVAFGSDDNLELAADNLRARALEQRGDYSHEYLLEWMHRHTLKQQDAAAALGVSRRMLCYYLSGAKPLPRTIALACLGWEAQNLQAA